jgi:23S rRNA (guanine1835-N2)-methyltransferase
MTPVTTSLADLQLTRYPDVQGAREPLRAWDAADEYLLRYLAGVTGATDVPSGVAAGPIDLSGTVAVFGDRWGALTTALAEHGPVQVTDSLLTQLATRANLSGIGVDSGADGPVRLASTMDPPPARIDVLLVRVPKSLALLEDQLRRLAPSVHAGTVVVGTGMVTEIHTSTLKLFEQIIGPTKTSLAVRKARLIFTAPDPAHDRPRAASPWPRNLALPPDVGVAADRTVVNHAGVFSGERLDLGARFFLRNLPWELGQSPGAPSRDKTVRAPTRIVDLGCGNGVLGLAAALAQPGAEVTFVDESYQAIASAKATMAANGLTSRTRFLVQDGLTDTPPDSVDLVLNNPPFHTHQTTTDETAWRMFTGSRSALRPGGELWVVGNRHLQYHAKLRRLFGNCEVVAGDAKFVVLRAVKVM